MDTKRPESHPERAMRGDSLDADYPNVKEVVEAWVKADKPIYFLSPAVTTALCFTKPLALPVQAPKLPHSIQYVQLAPGILSWQWGDQPVMEPLGFYLRIVENVPLVRWREDTPRTMVAALAKKVAACDSEAERKEWFDLMDRWRETKVEPWVLEVSQVFRGRPLGRRDFYPGDLFWCVELDGRTPFTGDLIPPGAIGLNRLMRNFLQAYTQTKYLKERQIRPMQRKGKKRFTSCRRDSRRPFTYLYFDTKTLATIRPSTARAADEKGSRKRAHLVMGFWNPTWTGHPQEEDIPDQMTLNRNGTILYRVPRWIAPHVRGYGPLPDNHATLVRRWLGPEPEKV